MSIKYILHGGSARDVNAKNTRFFEEILKDYNGNVNVLLVQFAAIAEKQESYREQHIEQFERAKGHKTLSFQVSDIHKFDEQLDWADVVYLGGASGGTVRILAILNGVRDLALKFQGKTVAGESAGANCLSAYCFRKTGGLLPGLGIVPINLIAHYQPGDELNMVDLDNDLETLKLRDNEFRVFII